MSIQITGTAFWTVPPEMLIHKVWEPEFYLLDKFTDHAEPAGLWATYQGHLYKENRISLVRAHWLALILPTSRGHFLPHGLRSCRPHWPSVTSHLMPHPFRWHSHPWCRALAKGLKMDAKLPSTTHPTCSLSSWLNHLRRGGPRDREVVSV